MLRAEVRNSRLLLSASSGALRDEQHRVCSSTGRVNRHLQLSCGIAKARVHSGEQAETSSCTLCIMQKRHVYARSYGLWISRKKQTRDKRVRLNIETCERRFNPRDEADFQRRRSVLDITTIRTEEIKLDGFRSLGWTEAIFVRRAGRKNAMHKTLIRGVNRHSAGVDFTTYLDNEVPSEATHVFFIEPASGHLHAYFDCVHFISPCFVLFSRFGVSSGRYIWRVYTATLRIKIVVAENEFSSIWKGKGSARKRSRANKADRLSRGWTRLERHKYWHWRFKKCSLLRVNLVSWLIVARTPDHGKVDEMKFR